MSAPLLTAHRGSMATHPENTLASFHRAAEVGADELELDVQLSADGVPVVCHDATVDRTTDGRGPVAELTAEELAALDAGDGRGLPTVAAVLAATRLPIQVEIKAVAAARLLAREVVPAASASSRVRFISFEPEALEVCRAEAPGVPRGIVTMTDAPAAIEIAVGLDADTVCVHWPLISPELVSEARARGLRVVGFVVDETTIQRAIELGLDSVTTNDPRPLRGIIDRTHVSGSR